MSSFGVSFAYPFEKITNSQLTIRLSCTKNKKRPLYIHHDRWSGICTSKFFSSEFLLKQHWKFITLIDYPTPINEISLVMSLSGVQLIHYLFHSIKQTLKLKLTVVFWESSVKPAWECSFLFQERREMRQKILLPFFRIWAAGCDVLTGVVFAILSLNFQFVFRHLFFLYCSHIIPFLGVTFS